MVHAAQPLPISVLARPDGLAQELVQCFRHGGDSLHSKIVAVIAPHGPLAKIARVALPLIIIAAAGCVAGVVAGYSLLSCCSAVFYIAAIPAAICVLRAWKTLESKEAEEIAKIKEAFLPVQEAFGEEAFDKLPTLGYRPSCVWGLSGECLGKHNAVKGVDAKGLPFVLFSVSLDEGDEDITAQIMFYVQKLESTYALYKMPAVDSQCPVPGFLLSSNTDSLEELGPLTPEEQGLLDLCSKSCEGPARVTPANLRTLRRVCAAWEAGKVLSSTEVKLAADSAAEIEDLFFSVRDAIGREAFNKLPRFEGPHRRSVLELKLNDLNGRSAMRSLAGDGEPFVVFQFKSKNLNDNRAALVVFQVSFNLRGDYELKKTCLGPNSDLMGLLFPPENYNFGSNGVTRKNLEALKAIFANKHERVELSEFKN